MRAYVAIVCSLLLVTVAIPVNGGNPFASVSLNVNPFGNLQTSLLNSLIGNNGLLNNQGLDSQVTALLNGLIGNNGQITQLLSGTTGAVNQNLQSLITQILNLLLSQNGVLAGIIGQNGTPGANIGANVNLNLGGNGLSDLLNALLGPQGLVAGLLGPNGLLGGLLSGSSTGGDLITRLRNLVNSLFVPNTGLLNVLLGPNGLLGGLLGGTNLLGTLQNVLDGLLGPDGLLGQLLGPNGLLGGLLGGGGGGGGGLLGGLLGPNGLLGGLLGGGGSGGLLAGLLGPNGLLAKLLGGLGGGQTGGGQTGVNVGINLQLALQNLLNSLSVGTGGQGSNVVSSVICYLDKTYPSVDLTNFMDDCVTSVLDPMLKNQINNGIDAYYNYTICDNTSPIDPNTVYNNPELSYFVTCVEANINNQ